MMCFRLVIATFLMWSAFAADERVCSQGDCPSTDEEDMSFLQMADELVQRRDSDSRSVENLDTTLPGKLGFGSGHKGKFCAFNWKRNLRHSSFQPTLKECKRQCEFSPSCVAISYHKAEGTCVRCNSLTELGDNSEWTTYKKKKTLWESEAHCRTDADCSFPGCNVNHKDGWEYKCWTTGGGSVGKCLNRKRKAGLCKGFGGLETPTVGHWCWLHDLYRMCPKQPEDDIDITSRRMPLHDYTRSDDDNEDNGDNGRDSNDDDEDNDRH